MKTQSLKLLPIALALLVLLGCVATDAVPLTDRTYPPTAPGEVTIYLSAADVPGPYVKVALLTARAAPSVAASTFFRALKVKAAALGANGLIVTGHRVPSTGRRIAAAFFPVDDRQTYQALAIRLAGRPAGD